MHVSGRSAVGWVLAGLAGCGFLTATVDVWSVAEAQTRGVGSPARKPVGEKAAGKTRVRVELLIGKGGAGLHAQQWGQIFDRLGISARIRQPLLDDQPDIKERTQGPLREVIVVGRLDGTGRIVFPGHSFTRAEGEKLNEWLRELQTYGAQGTPEGKPLWGLNKSQFDAVFGALDRKQETDVGGLRLEEALAKIDLPESYPVRLTTAARNWLRQEFPGAPPVRQEVQGIGKGTALALLLNDYGLGFRPVRTPEGTIELAVDPLKDTQDVWPVGWDLKLSRQETAPQLFQLVPVELNEVKLTDVLDAAAAQTDIPVFIDSHRIEGKGIEVDEMVVSYPSRRTTWSLLLRGVTTPHKLTTDLKIDEQGQPFVWVTVFEPRRPE